MAQFSKGPSQEPDEGQLNNKELVRLLESMKKQGKDDLKLDPKGVALTRQKNKIKNPIGLAEIDTINGYKHPGNVQMSP